MDLVEEEEHILIRSWDLEDLEHHHLHLHLVNHKVSLVALVSSTTTLMLVVAVVVEQVT